MDRFESTRVELPDAELEIVVPTTIDPTQPLVCAAHPADIFGIGTATLLADAAQAQVVCINPRGVGGSSPVEGAPAAAPPEAIFEQMVDDFDAVRLHLGVDRWLFWGLSGGGLLAQIYAHRRPAALRGIVIESWDTCFRERLADPACILSPFHPSWRDTLDQAGLLSASAHQTALESEQTVWNDVAGVGLVFRRKNGPALLVSPAPLSPEMLAIMPALWRADSRPWLASLALPALVIAGTDDPIVPLARVRAVHEAIAGSEFLAVEDGGHVPVTQRRPEVAAVVQAFLGRIYAAA
jgi:pimeloyl-ACP methyl ester carboxylesterase